MKIPLLFLALCFAWHSSCQGLCPTTLPQHTPWFCHLPRSIVKSSQQFDYGIEEPSPSMPFARLKNGILALTHLLLKNPPLKFHADKWRALALSNEVAKTVYMLGKTPGPPKAHEFSTIADHFKRHPALIFGNYVKIPSDHEPFQHSESGWLSDQHFAEQRLAGTNPMTLRRVTFSNEVGVHWNKLKSMLNDNFKWGSVISKTLNGMSLKTAIKKRHLYALHHPTSDDLKTMPDEGDKDPKRKMRKYTSPIALFASVPPKDSSSKAKLMPVAIQMDSKKDSSVYTPKDGDLWTLAKLNVQLTDFEDSQITEHLCKVHMVSEGLCLGAMRQLPFMHPFQPIMYQHCLGLFTLNTYGGPVLLHDKQKLDSLFPYGNEGSNTLTAKAAKMYTWSDLNLKNNIKRRGVDDTRRLPYYPYRDDGAEIAKTIWNMVNDYVNVYYHSDSDVRKDVEVQNFASEVSDKGKKAKVMIRGFPPRFDTKAQLVDTFAQMIWLMSGQHASVNYPMIDYVTYIPSTPLKLYDSERVPKTSYSNERLPNRDQSASQASFAATLGSYRENRLFDYAGHVRDHKGKDVVNRYFNHLKHVVDPLLEKRNRDRLKAGQLTYPYMQPRWVPNSIQT